MPYTYDPDAISVVPEGVQTLTIAEIVETESSKGDPMWIIRLVDAQDVELTEFVTHKPNIIDWKFRPLWEAAGLDWPEGRAVLDEHKLVGRRVAVTVKHERSEQFGLQARATGYAPVGTGSDTDPDGTAAQQFPVGSEAAAPSADDDDDIPFG